MKKEELELIYEILKPINMRVGNVLTKEALLPASQHPTMAAEEYKAVQQIRWAFNQAENALQYLLHREPT